MLSPFTPPERPMVGMRPEPPPLPVPLLPRPGVNPAGEPPGMDGPEPGPPPVYGLPPRVVPSDSGGTWNPGAPGCEVGGV